MIVLASALVGIVLGVSMARRNGGKPMDMLQYAASLGIGFTVLGVFITILIDRVLV